MLFSGKTMALPRQSISCQVFVKKTVSVCCFIFVSSTFSSFYAKGIFKCLSRHAGWNTVMVKSMGLLTMPGYQWGPSWEHAARSSWFLDASQKLPRYLISYNYPYGFPAENATFSRKWLALLPGSLHPVFLVFLRNSLLSSFGFISLCASHTLAEITFENSMLTLIFMLLFQSSLWCSCCC